MRRKKRRMTKAQVIEECIPSIMEGGFSEEEARVHSQLTLDAVLDTAKEHLKNNKKVLFCYNDNGETRIARMWYVADQNNPCRAKR